MYCSNSSCLKEVDINSVMKQQNSGGVILESELTDNDLFVSRTTNKVVNVCKSCGETDYLWKTEAEYKNYLKSERDKLYATKKAEDEAEEQYKEHRIQKPVANAFRLGTACFIICASVLGAGLWILNAVSTLFNDRGTALLSMKGLIFLTVILSTIISIIVGFGQLEKNKNLIKEERRKRLKSGNAPR